MLRAKSTFFFAAVEQNERSQRVLCGFKYHKGENLLCFLFSDPIIAGLGVSMKEMEGKARFDAMYRNFDTVL